MEDRYVGCYGSLCLRPHIKPKTTAEDTLIGDIRHHSFVSEKLKQTLEVLIYLPPGYSELDSWEYPVLYLHDGQNVFDKKTAVFGVEWGVDEAAEELIHAREMRGVIMVAVNNTPDRIDLYTPFPDAVHGGGKGVIYRDFLIEELKPWVDSLYSTTSKAEHTAVAGSSLGGLSSLYLAWTRPDVFGMAAALSPSLWWGGRGLITGIAGDTRERMPHRIWLDMGDDESKADHNRNGVPDVIDDVRTLKAVLLWKGFELERSFFYHEVDGGTHSEAAWAARIQQVLRALFPIERTPSR